MAGRLIAVVGGQYGSEGKGAVAGYLSATSEAPFMAKAQTARSHTHGDFAQYQSTQ